MKSLPKIAVALLVLAGAFLFWWMQPERVVTRRVEGLFKAAAVEPGTGSLGRATTGSSIESYLADRIALKSGKNESEDDEYMNRTYSRNDLVALYSSLSTHAKSISLKDLQIGPVQISGETATVNASVDAVLDIGSRRPLDGIQKMVMTWTKTPDGWKLSQATWKEEGR